jgi:hypothetical protein
MTHDSYHRRRVLQGAAGLAAVGLAGCLGDDTPDPDTPLADELTLNARYDADADPDAR